MALPPSRRDTIGPPPRDISDLAALVRHHQSWQRSVDPGILDGRFGTPRPVSHGPSQIVGGDAGGDGGDNDEIAFWNSDRATSTVAGTITLNLTYEPIDGSLHIRWNGLDQPPTEWTLDVQTVTFTSSYIKVGDVLTAAYAYYPLEDEPTVTGPATATLRGTSTAVGASGNPGLTSLALPTGTVIGDLIVVSAESGPVANLLLTDSRLTLAAVGSNMWIGWATSLADIIVTATGGFASNWSIACITLRTNAVSWTAGVLASDPTMNPGDTLAVGTVSDVAVAVCAVHDGHSTVAGTTDPATGYTAAATSGSSLSHSRVDYWTNPTVTTSPAGTTLFTGGAGSAVATVVGLVGPGEEV